MTDIARLGITVDSATVPQATQQLDRLGDQAAVTERQAKSAARGFSTMSRSLRGLSTVTRGGAGGIQNVAFQVGDFATQVGAGTAASVALAQQLPQLLGGFGAMGAVAGAATAVVIPLGAALFNLSDGADDGEEAMDRFLSALGEVERLAARAGTPIDELTDVFGRFAKQVQSASRIAAQAQLFTAMSEFNTAASTMREGLSTVRGELAEYNTALMNFNTTAAVLGERTVSNASAYEQAERSLEAARRGAVEAAGTLGLTADQAIRVDLALRNLANAEGMDQVADRAGIALALFESMFTEAESIPPEVAQIIVELEAVLTAAASAVTLFDDIEASASGAADQAGRIAANLDLARRGRALVANPDFADPRNESGTRWRTDIPDGDPRNPALDAYIADVDARARARNRPGSGGGTSDAQRLHNERLREAERIIERTRTETERYARELEDLNELHQMGYLDAEQYARGVDLIEAELNSVQFDSLRQGIDSLSDAMAQAIVNGESMGDAIANAFKQMAAEYIANDIRSILGGLFGLRGSTAIGGQGGGFFSAIFGGFRATGGPVSSGVPYVVGEQGPELFVPGASGQIVSNENSRAALSGGGGMTINVSQTFTGGVTQADLARLLPVMEERTKQAVVESVQRGGAMARAFR